jgi:hypothetical protein
LDFNDTWLKKWENLIGNFVSGNLRIAHNRIFSNTESGGLGLPALRDFLDAQKCSWVIRASKRMDSEWKNIIRVCTVHDFFNLNINLLSQYDAIFVGFGTAIKSFRKGYLCSNNNYLTVPVLEDELFALSTRNPNTLKMSDIDPHRNLEFRRKLFKLKLKDIYQQDGIISRAELTQKLGDHVIPVLYQKISAVARTARTKYHNHVHMSGINLQTFISNWVKGSKKFRKYIGLCKHQYISHNIVKYSYNYETIIGIECSKKLNVLWCNNYQSNELNTFLFKLTNNTLSFNPVLSHFVRGHSRNCTMCDLTGSPEIEDETPLHFFYQCPVAEQTRDAFFKWLTENENFTLTRHEFFCCLGMENKCRAQVLTVSIRLFMHYLWLCKLRKHLPVMTLLRKYVLSEINTMAKCNKKFLAIISNSGINVNQNRVF